MIRPDQIHDLHTMSLDDLHSLIAHASGVAAHRQGDGGLRVAGVLQRLADRLTGQPRRVA